MAQYKVTLTFPPELMKEIDEYCKYNYLTRSGFVQMASISYLNAHKMTKALVELTSIVRRMADEHENSGAVSEADIQQLDHIQELLDLMQGRGI